MNNNMRTNRPQPTERRTVPGQPQQKAKKANGFSKKQTAPTKFVQIIKRVKWGRIVILYLACFGAFCMVRMTVDAIRSGLEPEETTPREPAIVEEHEEPEEQEQIEYIFKFSDGCPVDVQGMTNAWATEVGYEKRYDLTDAERWEIASVVTAEAGGEPFSGMVAVAQCILQACEDDDLRPFEVVTKYRYTRNRPEPSKEALEAVQAVFDFGQVVTNEPIKYFYAPAKVASTFHESQKYVITINNHKFFAEEE